MRNWGIQDPVAILNSVDARQHIDAHGQWVISISVEHDLPRVNRAIRELEESAGTHALVLWVRRQQACVQAAYGVEGRRAGQRLQELAGTF